MCAPAVKINITKKKKKRVKNQKIIKTKILFIYTKYTIRECRLPDLDRILIQIFLLVKRLLNVLFINEISVSV